MAHKLTEEQLDSLHAIDVLLDEMKHAVMTFRDYSPPDRLSNPTMARGVKQDANELLSLAEELEASIMLDIAKRYAP